MGRRLRWNLRLGILGFLVACSHQRSPLPELRMVEQAIRSRIGAAAQPRVGYIHSSVSLLIDFEAAALPDTTEATFGLTARAAALTATTHYEGAPLDSIVVSAGNTLGPGVFRVLRQRTFRAAELR